MNLLIIGGSGYVASLLLPHLAQHHNIRIYDLRPPQAQSTPQNFDYVEGNVCDFDSVRKASAGIDAVLYMTMGRYLPIGEPYHEHVDSLTSSLDANVKGIYLSLYAAQSAGVQHAVYTSSMSVYDEKNLFQRYFADEEIQPDARDIYGFSKSLGELVCRNIWREKAMSVNILRLCFPMADEKWLAAYRDGSLTIQTSASDLAAAIDASLRLRAGCQTFTISGDIYNKYMNISKARSLLGWEPKLHTTGGMGK